MPQPCKTLNQLLPQASSGHFDSISKFKTSYLGVSSIELPENASMLFGSCINSDSFCATMCVLLRCLVQFDPPEDKWEMGRQEEGEEAQRK